MKILLAMETPHTCAQVGKHLHDPRTSDSSCISLSPLPPQITAPSLQPFCKISALLCTHRCPPPASAWAPSPNSGRRARHQPAQGTRGCACEPPGERGRKGGLQSVLGWQGLRAVSPRSLCPPQTHLRLGRPQCPGEAPQAPVFGLGQSEARRLPRPGAAHVRLRRSPRRRQRGQRGGQVQRQEHNPHDRSRRHPDAFCGAAVRQGRGLSPPSPAPRPAVGRSGAFAQASEPAKRRGRGRGAGPSAKTRPLWRLASLRRCNPASLPPLRWKKGAGPSRRRGGASEQ